MVETVTTGWDIVCGCRRTARPGSGVRDVPDDRSPSLAVYCDGCAAAWCVDALEAAS